MSRGGSQQGGGGQGGDAQGVGQAREPWHFDKRIPLALIGAIIIQTGSAFWWASSINERVRNLEIFQQDSKTVAADIAVIKSQITDIKATLDRIDARANGPKR